MTEHLYKRYPQAFVEEILDSFNKHRISERQACELLGIKRARLHRLRKDWLRKSARGNWHFVPERPQRTGEAFSEKERRFLHRELAYIRDKARQFRGKFNFAFLAEEAEKCFKHRFHRNAVRRFALAHGYYHMLPEETRKVYCRFETEAPGALFQHDTSHHIWLPVSGRYHDVIMTKDDHSRKVVAGKLMEQETTWGHFQVARATVETVGLPVAYYVDRHSIFRFTGRAESRFRHATAEDEGKVQFRRALRMLEVAVLYTSDAESKGKIEKMFDYFQRRLPYLCEKYSIKTIGAAQKILDDLIFFYNTKHVHEETGEIPEERWQRALREDRAKLRPLPTDQDLDFIFSLHYERTVKKDGTISFGGVPRKIGAFPLEKVTCAVIPGKKLMVYKDSHKIWEYHLQH